MFFRHLGNSSDNGLHVSNKVKPIVGFEYGPLTLGGLGEIFGLLVPPGKASKLLTDHLITG